MALILVLRRLGLPSQNGWEQCIPYSILRPSTCPNIAANERNNILITGGALTVLNTVLQKVTCPGYTRRIFMVAPTYYLAAAIFKGMSFDST